MSEIVDGFRALKQMRQRDGNRNRAVNRKAYEDARAIAESHGMKLTMHTEAHYSLRSEKSLWNLYPGNQRIYVDAAHRKATPFLAVSRHPWTLLDIVSSVVGRVNRKRGGK